MKVAFYVVLEVCYPDGTPVAAEPLGCQLGSHVNALALAALRESLNTSLPCKFTHDLLGDLEVVRVVANMQASQ